MKNGMVVVTILVLCWLIPMHAAAEMRITPGGATTSDSASVRLNGSFSTYSHEDGPSGAVISGENSFSGSLRSYGGYFTSAGYGAPGVYGAATGENGHGVDGIASGVSGIGVYGRAVDKVTTMRITGGILYLKAAWGKVFMPLPPGPAAPLCLRKQPANTAMVYGRLQMAWSAGQSRVLLPMKGITRIFY